MTTNTEAMKFSVSARALLHLGAELITSDEIAIYELIKNSFDAKAKSIKIKIVAPIPWEVVQDVIFDIKASWAESVKNQSIKKLLSSIREDASERILESTRSTIEKLYATQSEDAFIDIVESINRIEITDDGCGIGRTALKEAFLMIGTSFKVAKKNDGTPYLGNKGIGRLSMMRLGKRAEVSSWTSRHDNAWRITFNWDEFDNSDKLIQDISFPIRSIDKPLDSQSGVKIKIKNLTSDWTIDEIQEGIINKFLRRLQNPFSENLKRFPIHISYNGQRRIPIKPINKELIQKADRKLVLEFDPAGLDGNNSILKTEITRPGRDGSEEIFFRGEKEIREKIEASQKTLDRIGPFSLKLLWFNRSNLTKGKLGSDWGKYKTELNHWSGGIAIYRDGFRVGLTGSESDGDWLGLDSGAFRGKGFTVNRIQIIGALEIGHESNPSLTDRSNREGLIDSTESKALRALLVEFGANLLKTQIQAESEKEKTEQISAMIDSGSEGIENRLSLARKNINDIKSTASPDAKKHILELEDNIQFISNHVVKFSNAISNLQEKREDILELAGVGTVMHSILHELARTTTQTRTLLSQVSKKADPDTSSLIKKLEDEIKSINIRLRQLDPLSTSGRQRKQKFDLVKFTSTILQGYRARCERHHINIVLTVDGSEPKGEILINMVRGFYSLALENLLSNSFYWLKKGPILGKEQGKIEIEIDSKSKVVMFSDNGPGISPPDRERVFNPGFSLKSRGSGYGLYIAREVSEHHESNIYLADSEHPDKKLRTFIMELPRN